jgi:hypothetical protein
VSYSGSVLGHFLSETSESSSGSRSQENEKDKSLHNLPQNWLVVGYEGKKSSSLEQPWVNPHSHWYHGKNPKIHLKIISKYYKYPMLRQSQGSNLAFLRLNMTTKRPHSERSRYQCGCWFTLASPRVSTISQDKKKPFAKC